jgi:hypothetical protein
VFSVTRERKRAVDEAISTRDPGLAQSPAPNFESLQLAELFRLNLLAQKIWPGETFCAAEVATAVGKLFQTNVSAILIIYSEVQNGCIHSVSPVELPGFLHNDSVAQNERDS